MTEGKVSKKQKWLNDPVLTELRNKFSAENVLDDDDSLKKYGKDWTEFDDPDPAAVVFPRTTGDVSRLLKFCYRRGIPVVPSGGRTGLAAGALAARGEIIISFEKMNRMDEVDTLAQTVRVQAGAITENVHKHCAQQGLTWPVDFASKGSSHVGGNISTNAGGVRVIRYGLTRNWVLGLEVVLMDGTVLDLNGSLEKNNTGIDLRQLFIGTEGTLGVVTEATLKLIRPPGPVKTFFFSLSDLSASLKLFEKARREGPFELMAFEYLDKECLKIVLEDGQLRAPFKKEANSYVLMEVEAPDSDEQQAKIDGWLEGVFEQKWFLDGTMAQSPADTRNFWALRESIGEKLFTKGMVHKNDVALPISRIEPFVQKLEQVFKNTCPELTVFNFGHVGDGNLHINLLKPKEMKKSDFLEMCKASDQELFKLVQVHQGSISAEHGVGLLKKPYLKFSRTKDELAVFDRLKEAFDPKGLLNPGKVYP